MGMNFTTATINIEEAIENREKLLHDIANCASQACLSRVKEGRTDETILKDLDKLLSDLTIEERLKVTNIMLFNIMKNGKFGTTSNSVPKKSSNDDYVSDIFSARRRH